MFVKGYLDSPRCASGNPPAFSGLQKWSYAAIDRDVVFADRPWLVDFSPEFRMPT